MRASHEALDLQRSGISFVFVFVWITSHPLASHPEGTLAHETYVI